MTILLYLVPAALGLGLLALAAFMWSLKSDQFEDLDGAAYRILNDDDVRSEYTWRVFIPSAFAQAKFSAPAILMVCRSISTRYRKTRRFFVWLSPLAVQC